MKRPVLSEAPIQKVVDSDLCIACGACVEACPATTVHSNYSPARGAWEVAIANPEACLGCDAPCGTVCPSVNVFARSNPAPSRTGSILAVRTGVAPPFVDAGVSSSGGVLRGIVAALIDDGVPVIALCRDASPPGAKVTYGPRRLATPEDLACMPGSIYHSVNYADAIPLLRESSGPVAIVALPCQLEGIDNYIRQEETSLADKIYLRVGVICGWMYSDHAIHNYLDALAIEEPWTDAQYRGEDEVGRLKIDTGSGRISHSRRRFASWRQAVAYHSSFSRDANRLRCRLCQNHVNVEADIAVGDAWLARRRGMKESVVVTRSERAEVVVRRLMENDALDLAAGSEADLIESQSHDLVFGVSAQRRVARRAAQGLISPRYQFEADSSQAPTPASHVSDWLEHTRRRLLRNGRYRSFRTLHLITRPRAYADFLLGSVLRLLGRK